MAEQADIPVAARCCCHWKAPVGIAAAVATPKPQDPSPPRPTGRRLSERCLAQDGGGEIRGYDARSG